MTTWDLLVAVTVGVVLWTVITAAAVVAYVYVGLGCRGWGCLLW